MGLDYAWEKFHLASLALVADLPIKQRVIGAIVVLRRLSTETDLPKDIAANFKLFMAEVTKVPAVENEGRIADTINSLPDEEVEKVAEQIIWMYDDVARAFGQQ